MLLSFSILLNHWTYACTLKCTCRFSITAFCSLLMIGIERMKYFILWTLEQANSNSIWPTVILKTLWTRFYADISETIHDIFIQTHNSIFQFCALSWRPRVNMTTGYWDTGTKLSPQSFLFYCKMGFPTGRPADTLCSLESKQQASPCCKVIIILLGRV